MDDTETFEMGTAPMVQPKDKTVAQLRQVTITGDDQISKVNDLLKDGWRLLSVGYLATETVYVLARTEDKPKHRPGFLAGNDN